MRRLLFTICLTFLSQLVTALPPGCLLQAVNTQNQPGDLSAVCGDGALIVQSYMAGNCGTAAEEAQKQFIATCSSAGTSVAAYTSTATSSLSSTTSSSPSSTGTSTITSSTKTSSSASGTAGSTQSTAGANVQWHEGKGPMAAALVLVGAVAAL